MSVWVVLHNVQMSINDSFLIISYVLLNLMLNMVNNGKVNPKQHIQHLSRSLRRESGNFIITHWRF